MSEEVVLSKERVRAAMVLKDEAKAKLAEARALPWWRLLKHDRLVEEARILVLSAVSMLTGEEG